MARRNEFGRYILSAGEIASYTVCPEAWRLKTIERVDPQLSENMAVGEQAHREWSSDLDEAMYFTRSVRLILVLLAVVIGVFLATTRFPF